MRPNNVIVLVVAILMGGIAAFLARSWLVNRSEAAAPHLSTIVAASKVLPFGTPLTDENVQEIPWAAKTLPAGAFSTKKDLFKDGKRITLAAVQSDELILSSKITGPGQRAGLSALLDKDKRAVTIRVDDVRGVAGFILPNDRVDVMLIRSESESGARKDYSDLLLQDVKVIAVDQIFAEQKDKPVVAKAVTLEVTPYQAQKISLASSVGHLSLTLRKAGDSEVVTNQRVTQADLTEGEPPVAKPIKEAAAVAPPPAPVYVPPPRDTSATVTIIRDMRSEDYKVPRQSR